MPLRVYAQLPFPLEKRAAARGWGPGRGGFHSQQDAGTEHKPVLASCQLIEQVGQVPLAVEMANAVAPQGSDREDRL